MTKENPRFKLWPEYSAYEDEFLKEEITRCVHHAKIGNDISIFLDIFDKIRETETVTPSQYDTLSDRLLLNMDQTVHENPYEWPAIVDAEKATRQVIHNSLPSKGDDSKMSLEEFNHLFGLTCGLKTYHRDSMMSSHYVKASDNHLYDELLEQIYLFLSKNRFARKGFGILVPDNDMPPHLVDYDHMTYWCSSWVIIDPNEFISFNAEADAYIPNFYAVQQFVNAYNENKDKPFSEVGEFFGYRFDPTAKHYAICVDEDTYKFAVKRSKEIASNRQLNPAFDSEAESELNLLLDVVKNYKADHDNDDPNVRTFHFPIAPNA